MSSMTSSISLQRAATTTGELGNRITQRDYILLAAVLVLTVVLRIAFAHQVISRHTNKSFSLIHGDTSEYVHLAENMNRYGYYADEHSVFSRYRALVRTPGYPTFYYLLCKIGFDLDDNLPSIIWAQIPLSAIVVVIAYFFGRMILAHRGWAAFVATLSAISPTGVAMPSLAVADMLFSALFYLSLLAAVASLKSARRSLPWLTGAALAIAALTKPAALPIVPLLVVVAFIRHRASWQALRTSVAFALPTLIATGAWTARNFALEGSPTYSVVTTRNLAFFVMPKVQFRNEFHRWPTQREFGVEFRRLALAQEDYIFRTPNANAKGVVEKQKDAIAFDSPLVMARLFARNLLNQNTNRWKSSHRQVPGNDRVGNAIRTAYDHSGTWQVIAIELGMTAFGIAIFVLRRRTFGVAIVTLMVGSYLAIVLPTMTVADEGSRLVYAAELPGILFSTIAIRTIVNGTTHLARNYMRH